MKHCNICKQLLPLDQFHKDRTQSGGLSRKCRSCRKVIEAKRDRSAFYADRRRRRSADGKCSACGRPKPCQQCADYQAQYRQKHSEKLRAYHASYRDQNRERIAEYHRNRKRQQQQQQEPDRNGLPPEEKTPDIFTMLRGLNA